MLLNFAFANNANVFSLFFCPKMTTVISYLRYLASKKARWPSSSQGPVRRQLQEKSKTRSSFWCPGEMCDQQQELQVVLWTLFPHSCYVMKNKRSRIAKHKIIMEHQSQSIYQFPASSRAQSYGGRPSMWFSKCKASFCINTGRTTRCCPVSYGNSIRTNTIAIDR